ncbi:MAG: hypothetical protein K2X53_04020, partial [Alphaproteobacteria bacterium]|nr:hypothetical protein [Alphaproteobacteria bacterium]
NTSPLVLFSSSSLLFHGYALTTTTRPLPLHPSSPLPLLYKSLSSPILLILDNQSFLFSTLVILLVLLPGHNTVFEARALAL